MNNPMLQAIMGSRIGGVKQMMNALRSAGNPQFALQQMASGNPAVKQALDLVNQNGGDAKAAFYNLAQQYGIDPESIMGMLK